MSHDDERTAFQQGSPPRARTPETGITASPPSARPRPATSDDISLPGVSRLAVVGAGLALGAVFALVVAGPMMPSGARFADRILAWSSVMSGPILGTIWDLSSTRIVIGVGWLGLILIPAHPIRPCVATGCLTMLGFAVWYFAGWVAIMAAVWGA